MSEHIEPKQAVGPATCPELRRLTKQEWSEVYFAAIELGERALRGKDAAYEATHEAYIKLCTSHRWDPERCAFKAHFLRLVARECERSKEQRKEEVEGIDSEVELGEAFYAEAALDSEHAQSAEDQMIGEEDEDARDTWLPVLRSQLRRLQRRLKGSHAAEELLAYWAANGADRPLSHIAFRLNLPAADVYAAKRQIQRECERILAALKGEDR